MSRGEKTILGILVLGFAYVMWQKQKTISIDDEAEASLPSSPQQSDQTTIAIPPAAGDGTEAPYYISNQPVPTVSGMQY